MIGRNEKGLVSVIYCCITNSPRAQWPETTNIISHSVWKSGIQEGLGYVVQAHLMVVGRFHFLAGNGLETSVPRHVGLSTGLPKCPQDMAAGFPHSKCSKKGSDQEGSHSIFCNLISSLLLYSIGQTDQPGTGEDFIMLYQKVRILGCQPGGCLPVSECALPMIKR